MRTSLHRLTLLAWLSMLATVIALLLELDTRFPAPPLDGAVALRGWWSAQDPLDAVAGVARLLCLALVSYLFVVSVVQLVARRRGWHRCANAAGRAAPRFVAVFVAALVATTTSAGATPASSTAGQVDVPAPITGSGAQMVLLDEGPATHHRTPLTSSTPSSTVPAPSPTATARPHTSLPVAGAPTTSTTTPPRSTTSTVAASPPLSTAGPRSGSPSTAVPDPAQLRMPTTTTAASPATVPLAPAAGATPTSQPGAPTPTGEVRSPLTTGAMTSPDLPADDPAPVIDPGAPVTAGTAHYVVQPGDHLWSIAEQTLAARSGGEPSDREVSAYWRELVRANEHRFVEAGNADLILPGQHLELPA